MVTWGGDHPDGPGPRGFPGCGEAAVAAWGLVLLAVRLLVPAITFATASGRVSIGGAHALCSSAAGIWAQAASPPAASDCGHVALLYDGLNLVAAGAVMCAAVVIAALLRAGR